MCLLNRLALASRAEDNGCVSSLVTKFFVRKIIRKYVYWAKPGLGEYIGSSLLHQVYNRMPMQTWDPCKVIYTTSQLHVLTQGVAQHH